MMRRYDEKRADERHAEKFERLFSAEAAQDARIIKRLYGRLPDWLPPTVLSQIQQALDCMRKAKQPAERISARVTLARRNQYTVPGTALDTRDFIKSLSDLAHVQWALEQRKAKAIAELAGSYAAKDYKRSKDGNDEQAKARAEKLPENHPLKSVHSIQERNRLIRQHADQLRRAHPNLKAPDIKQYVAKWAQMSPKQIGRILNPSG